MQRLSISDVCEILDVKPHVLRYWERHVALLQPAKSASGRRAYSRRDLDVLFRLKYLLHQRKFTLDGAAQKLLEETEGLQADVKGAVQAVRSTLVDTRRRSAAAHTRLHAQVSSRRIDADVTEWLNSREQSEAQRTRRWAYRREAGTVDLDPASRRRGWAQDLQGLAVISPGPNWNLSPSSYPVLEPVSLTGRRTVLDLTARKLRLLQAQRRNPVIWIIPVPERMLDPVRSLLVEAAYFGLPRDAVSIIPLRDLEDASGTGYTSPAASFWAALALGKAKLPEHVETLLWLPLDVPYESLPSAESLHLHRRSGADVTAFAWERPGTTAFSLIPTGSLIMDRDAVDSLVGRIQVRRLPLRQDVILEAEGAEQQNSKIEADDAPAAGAASEERTPAGRVYVGVPEILAAARRPLVLARSGSPPLFVRTREEARRCRAYRYTATPIMGSETTVKGV